MALPPDFASILSLGSLSKRLEEATSEADYLAVIRLLEAVLPANPWPAPYVITPPTLKPRSTWAGALQNLSIEPAAAAKMSKSGFMPIEWQVFSPTIGAPVPEENGCLDVDYGVLLRERSGQLGNVLWTRSLLNHYQRNYPPMQEQPELFFSIGAIRGREALRGLQLGGNPYQVPEVKIRDRKDLSKLTAMLQVLSILQPRCEIWYRGQDNDWLLADLTKEAEQGICPWRGVRDTSLIPSLYRVLPKKLDDVAEYCAFCKELAFYTFFIKSDLAIPDYSSQDVAGEIGKLLGQEWLSADFVGTTEGAEDGAQERHYLNTFRGIQRSFFLQHYGLPSSILDITHDVNVALFFAQNKLVDNRYERVDFAQDKPVVYVFILIKGVDMFINSKNLSEHYGLLRPLRQQCGLVAGASLINRNNYGRLLALKLHLEQPVEYGDITPGYLFPSPDEDEFLRHLLLFQEQNSLFRLSPFVLKST